MSPPLGGAVCAQIVYPAPLTFIIFSMVLVGIVRCSDTASELWTSPVAKKQIPDVSLSTQLHKSTSLLTQLHCVFSWVAYVKLIAGFLRAHFSLQENPMTQAEGPLSELR